MKVKVLKRFLDKYDNSVEYEAGQILEWNDQNRIADCTTRGLVELIPEPEEKPKKAKKAK